MPKKPSDEELEQRLEELGKQFRTTIVSAALKKFMQLFERTFRSRTDAIFILDVEIHPKIIDCNTAAERIFGYSREEMLNQTTEFLHISRGEMRDVQERMYPKAIEQGFFRLDDSMMKRKGREKFHAEHTVMPLNDDRGECVGWVSVVRDVTRRKKAEDDLRASERKYRELFNNALAGIYRTRISDGKIIAANYRQAKMFGYDSLQEFIDEYIFSEHYVDAGTREKLLEQLWEKGEVSDFEARFSRRDGKIIWVRFSARILREEGYLDGVAIDATDEKEALAKLVDSEAKYRLLVENANDAIFIVQGTKIEFPNPRAREMGKPSWVHWKRRRNRQRQV